MVLDVMPTKLEAGEDYASVDDILTCSDLPEATVRVPEWKKAGKPLVIRVRAPSLEQTDTISREATRKDGTVDETAEVVAILRECIIYPKFTLAQASQLRQKNGTVARKIARFCVVLGSLKQEVIDAAVQELSGARPASNPDA